MAVVSVDSKKKIREALELLQEAAKNERTELQEQVRNRYAELKSVLSDARTQISEGAGRVAEFRDRSQDKAREIAGRVDDYARSEPWRMIGAAAGIGLLAGLLLNRNRHRD
jgi:ElaB/YqjD/DUF883 family membrane-anchored ribosome-binding protein